MKKIFIWFFILLFLAAFGALPSFFSTESGKKIALGWINKNISGDLSIEKMELSWLSKQRLTNFQLKDGEGKEILRVPFLETKTSLFYLLFGGRSFNETIIKEPYLYLEKKENNETNLEKALTKKEKPKAHKKKSFPKFKNNLSVQNGTLILSSSKIRPITISEIFIEKQLTDAVRVSAKTTQGNISGKLNFNASFSKLLQIQADIKNFPVAVFDQFLETSLFSESLGATLNSNLYLSKEETAIRIEGEVISSHLRALIKGDTYDGMFYLAPDTRLNLSLTPAFFASLISPSQKDLWTLKEPVDLNVQIEKGIFPLQLKSKADFQNIVFQGTAKLENAKVAHPSLGVYALNHSEFSIIMLNNLEIAYKGKIQGKDNHDDITDIEGCISITPDKKFLFNFDYKNFPVSIVDLFSPKAAQNLSRFFGKTLDISGNGTTVEKLVGCDFTIGSKALHLKGNLDGKFPDFNVKLTGSSKILSEPALAHAEKFLGSTLGLQAEGKLNLENKNPSMPSFHLKLFNAGIDADFKGRLGEEGKPFSMKNVYLTSSGKFKLPENSEIPTKEASFSLQMDGSKNLISGKSEATFGSETSSFSFEAKNFIQKESFSLEDLDVSFNSNLSQFPTEILQSFVTNGISLPKLIGDKLSLKGEGIWGAKKGSEGKPKAVFTVNAKGVGFQTSLSFAFDQTLKILQNKPSYFYWELTPDRYKALLAAVTPNYSPKFLLSRTAPVELKIAQLNCLDFPKKGAKTLATCGFRGELDVGALVFKSLETKESFLIQKIAGSVNGDELAKEINFSLNGFLAHSSISVPERSSFSFQGHLLNAFTPQGQLNKEQMAIKGEWISDHLPVRQLTGILPLKEEVRKTTQALLGDYVNARIHGEISKQQGPLVVDIQGSNFKARLPLFILPDSIRLLDTVEAEMTLTPEVNETLLKDINPLLITGAFSDHPIKVYIEKEGFTIPLKPFNFSDVFIEKGIIDLGKIRVRNGGHFQALMEFLKAKDISENREMDAWFTPVFFSLKEGVVSYKRFDALLAGNIHNALWGTIDLINDKVHMTLGIAPTTLKQRFNILGISKKDMFQVKMHGTTEKLELDWSSAYTRIGILVARTAGGHIGYIIGGIVEQLVSLLGEEPTPDPTTYPLPWASDGDQEEAPKEEKPEETPPPSKPTKKFFKKVLQFLIP